MITNAADLTWRELDLLLKTKGIVVDIFYGYQLNPEDAGKETSLFDAGAQQFRQERLIPVNVTPKTITFGVDGKENVSDQKVGEWHRLIGLKLIPKDSHRTILSGGYPAR